MTKIYWTVVTGAKLDPATGQAKIAITAGGVGEQNFGGQFTFVEDGKTIPLKFEGVCGCSKTQCGDDLRIKWM
jgi:hypothetical protein